MAETLEFKGAKFVVHRIDPAQEKLQVFWRDEDGKKYGTFGKLEAALKAKGKRLKFATNAGIYAIGFASLFKHLGCDDALFLDGDISEVFIRGETGETPQQTSDFAAILAVVEEAP